MTIESYRQDGTPRYGCYRQCGTSLYAAGSKEPSRQSESSGQMGRGMRW